MLKNGYRVTNISTDSSGQAIITLTFSGMGNATDGQIYYLITKDVKNW